MPKKIKPLSFDETVSQLRSHRFDVQEVPQVANQALANHVRVSKYDCAAVLGRDGKGGVVMAHKPGIVLEGEIAILMDRGFQKFFKTSKLEMAATAERLKAEHRFAEELDDVTGTILLYNQSLGTTSDEYMYDRLKGRNGDRPAKGRAPWAQTAGTEH
ncbi:MAG: hypothetical protein WAM66_05180 [Acidobacteriaceae bacterium]